MAHIEPDFKIKKDFLKAFKEGKEIKVFNPSGLFPMSISGITTIEAPADYHKWYCRVKYTNYVIKEIIP